MENSMRDEDRGSEKKPFYINVRRKGVMVHRTTFKFWREENKELWNTLRAGKEVRVDLNQWVKCYMDEFGQHAVIDVDPKVHFFRYNPGLGIKKEGVR